MGRLPETVQSLAVAFFRIVPLIPDPSQLSHAFGSLWATVQSGPGGLAGEAWDDLCEWVARVEREDARIRALSAIEDAGFGEAYFRELNPARRAGELAIIHDLVFRLVYESGVAQGRGEVQRRRRKEASGLPTRREVTVTLVVLALVVAFSVGLVWFLEGR